MTTKMSKTAQPNNLDDIIIPEYNIEAALRNNRDVVRNKASHPTMHDRKITEVALGYIRDHAATAKQTTRYRRVAPDASQPTPPTPPAPVPTMPYLDEPNEVFPSARAVARPVQLQDDRPQRGAVLHHG